MKSFKRKAESTELRNLKAHLTIEHQSTALSIKKDTRELQLKEPKKFHRLMTVLLEIK